MNVAVKPPPRREAMRCAGRRIETDAEGFKSDVQNAGAGEVVVMNPGDTHSA